jgi:hypothetical protein
MPTNLEDVFGKPPAGGWRWTPEGNLERVPGGPADVAHQEKIQREEKQREAIIRRTTTALQDAGRSLELVQKGGIKVAGPGAVAARVPMTDAKELAGHLQSIKSNISIEELRIMRETSPTGGALGQVPVRQQEYLMEVLGALDQSQNPRVLEENLKRIMNLFNDVIHGEGNGPERHALAFDSQGRRLKQPREWRGADKEMPQEFQQMSPRDAYARLRQRGIEHDEAKPPVA